MSIYITIFTPTYNRAYILPRLYESLEKQSVKYFEWLVVDDGSTDNTERLVSKWEREGTVTINYIKTSNGGKQRAINRGVREAKGELFFIVDSDDFLTPDAIAIVQKDWGRIKNEKTTLSGLCYKRVVYETEKFMGIDFPEPPIAASLLDMVYKYKIKGDKAEIFKTEMMRDYPFPEILGEKFVPEAYIWNRITTNKPMYFINKGIYFCEYLQDGLTANFCRNLRQNPMGFKLYYNDVLCYEIIPLKNKFKAVVRIIQCIFFLTMKRLYGKDT